jgi:hypothetical protein
MEGKLWSDTATVSKWITQIGGKLDLIVDDDSHTNPGLPLLPTAVGRSLYFVEELQVNPYLDHWIKMLLLGITITQLASNPLGNSFPKV